MSTLMNKIFITGANGFVGNSLCSIFEKSDRTICGSVRSLNSSPLLDKIKYVSVGDIGPETNWKNVLAGYDCVIHCAGKTNNMRENDESESYFSINVEGTKRLALQAASVGVKRLVFLSTIKIYGENTDRSFNNLAKNKVTKKIFSQNDLPNPIGPYAVSKCEAEKVLWQISDKTGLEIVILRVPLVYGYGTQGNLARLIRLINYGIPLPFNAVKNQRSLIGIDNLADVLMHCVDSPDAVGEIFLVSDGEDLSTPKLINYIAQAMGKSSRLFSIPISLLKFVGLISGHQKEINRLIGSLQIDNSYARKVLNWTPRTSCKEGIRRMVNGK
tara:strand:+ start:485 stop:1471 length:987 start_codon:yes stop_codon:yes gene_type:complete